MDDCQQGIKEQYDASMMESLERFHHECSSLQPNEVVEYGKILLRQGCTIDFAENCEDDDVGIIGLAGAVGITTAGCASFVASVNTCDDAEQGQQIRELCPLTCGECVPPGMIGQNGGHRLQADEEAEDLSTSGLRKFKF